MKHFIQRIIPIDQTLKDQFEQESKKHLEKWFNKWFGKNTLIYKGLVEDIQKSSEDEIYILVNHKPIMRFCCSMSMLIKLLTGRSISDNNHDQALKFILRLVEDLINRFGTFKDEKITIGNNDNKENPLSLSVYSVDTHSGFIEIDFFIESYARFLKAKRIPKKRHSKQIEIDSENKFQALKEQKLHLNIDLDHFDIKAKDLLDISVGKILISTNKLINPVPIKVNKHIVGKAFIGKNSNYKIIKVGERQNDREIN